MKLDRFEKIIWIIIVFCTILMISARFGIIHEYDENTLKRQMQHRAFLEQWDDWYKQYRAEAK